MSNIAWIYCTNFEGYFRDQMLSNVRARQTVRDKKKVSKKPEMPMIMAAEVGYRSRGTAARIVAILSNSLIVHEPNTKEINSCLKMNVNAQVLPFKIVPWNISLNHSSLIYEIDYEIFACWPLIIIFLNYDFIHLGPVVSKAFSLNGG